MFKTEQEIELEKRIAELEGEARVRRLKRRIQELEAEAAAEAGGVSGLLDAIRRAAESAPRRRRPMVIPPVVVPMSPPWTPALPWWESQIFCGVR